MSSQVGVQHRELAAMLQTLPRSELREEFIYADEFLICENFFPTSLLLTLQSQLSSLNGSVHRNFIPRHKKGGSISRFELDTNAPVFASIYQDPILKNFLSELAAVPLLESPTTDPHAYALYYYTEPGDHIGYHYDTSYYRGSRYTMLLGLVDNSDCVLEYQLHRRNPNRETETHALPLSPGTMVFFNGDKLYHRITPLRDKGSRIALTFEYLTDSRISRSGRFVSNMKDAIAYFGLRQVFQRRARQ